MTNEDLQMLLKRNAALSLGDPRQTTAVECHTREEPLATEEVQRRPSGRVLVVVTSIRKYDCDDDAPCSKFHVDLLRYAGILTDDSQKHCKIQTHFQKAQKNEEERTEIEIYELIEP